MFATVNVERPDPRLARAWLEASVTHLFPDLWALPRAGHVTVTPYEDGPINTWKRTPERWEQALAALDQPDTIPETVSVGLVQGERFGRASAGWASDRGVELGAGTSNDADWFGFLVSLLADANPSYGQVSSSAEGASTYTELDMALLRHARESFVAGRTALRGYSWITVVPAELAGRVDPSTMHRTASLPGGGLILQATATPAEYDEAAVCKVFRAVAQALPPGLPKQPPARNLQVVFEDASTVG